MQRLTHAAATEAGQREARQPESKAAQQAYLRGASALLQGAEKGVQAGRRRAPPRKNKLLKIEAFMHHAQRQLKQAERRVMQGERLPPQEQVGAIFEPYTAGLRTGKAGVPGAWGVAGGRVEDQDQCILQHRGMQQETAVDSAVPMVPAPQARLPELSSGSFAQGWHAPAHRSQRAHL